MTDVYDVHRKATELLIEHDLFQEGWRIIWTRNYERAGLCDHRTREITLTETSVLRWGWGMAYELIAHELGHAIMGPGAEHGKAWKAAVRSLGGSPEEHCPEFSSNNETMFGTGNGLYVVGLIVASAFFVSATAGLLFSGVAVAGVLSYGVKRLRPPTIGREEGERISQEVWNQKQEG